MPNVLKAYECYKGDVVAQFNDRVSNVVRELLRISEQIPQEKLLKYFSKDATRNIIFFGCIDGMKKCFIGDPGKAGLGLYEFDSSVYEEFNDFLMKQYHSNFTIDDSWELDLKKKTIKIYFSCKSDLVESDFENYQILPEAECKSINVVCDLFLDDIETVIGRPLNESEYSYEMKHYHTLEANYDVTFKIDKQLIEEALKE